MATTPFIDPSKLNQGHVVIGINSETRAIAELDEETAYSNISRKAAPKNAPPLTSDNIGMTHVVRRLGTDRLVIVYNHVNVRRAHDELGATHIPVVIHDVRSLDEEAELMEQLHTFAPRLNDTQKHTLRVSWGEPIALRVEEILNSVGLTATNNDHTRPRIVAVAALRYAWGDDGRFSSKVVLTQKQLDRGAAVLTWIVKSLIGRVAIGDKPNSVFRKATIRALAWIGRFGKKKPNWSAMQRLLTPMSLDDIAYAVLGREYKNSRASVWAHNLRDVLDTLAGTPLIEIPELNKR